MADTIPKGSRDDPLVGPTTTGTGTTGRVPALPRPRSPEPQPPAPQVAAPVVAPASAPASPEPDDNKAVPTFLELLEEVLTGASLMGRQRPALRERCRRWLLPVGTSGEPLILFCGWLLALSIALAAFADFGPFSEPDDATLMLAAEGILTVAVFMALALAKSRRARTDARPARSHANGDRTGA
jgi:hypothetical protein